MFSLKTNWKGLGGVITQKHMQFSKKGGTRVRFYLQAHLVIRNRFGENTSKDKHFAHVLKQHLWRMFHLQKPGIKLLQILRKIDAEVWYLKQTIWYQQICNVCQISKLQFV